MILILHQKDIDQKKCGNSLDIEHNNRIDRGIKSWLYSWDWINRMIKILIFSLPPKKKHSLLVIYIKPFLRKYHSTSETKMLRTLISARIFAAKNVKIIPKTAPHICAEWFTLSFPRRSSQMDNPR